MKHDDLRPRIYTGPKIRETTDHAIHWLKAQGIIKERGHQLVEVIVDQRPAPVDEESPPARAVVITLHRLIELCSEAAAWVEIRMRMSPDGEAQYVEHEVQPPIASVQKVMDRQGWDLPTLRGVTETPFIRPDGSLVTTPGYDEATGYYLAPSRGLDVRVHPEADLDDANAAYERLLDLFADFPFELQSHAAGAVAAVLTLVARPAIKGPCPLFMVTSSTPGSGKSLLVDVIHAIGAGRKLERTAFPKKEDELEKRITSVLMASFSAACFDNIDSSFGGPSLDLLITSSTWMGRQLGQSRMVTLPALTVWFATGNNVRLAGDMGRRIVPIRIEPQMEHPEDRVEFKHPAILRHIHANRSAILSDALTILSAYCRAGRPKPGPGFGSFDEWNDLVRGAVVWAGGQDPAIAARAWAYEADEQRGLFEALAIAWSDSIGGRAVPLSELQSIASAQARTGFMDALKAIAGKNGVLDTHLLGNRLRRQKGRIFGGFRFESPKEKVHNACAWMVVRATPTVP